MRFPIWILIYFYVFTKVHSRIHVPIGEKFFIELRNTWIGFFNEFRHGNILFCQCERYEISIWLISGAIFDIENEEAEIAFKYAIFRENMYGAKFNLVPNIKVIDATNTFEVEQAGEQHFMIIILSWKKSRFLRIHFHSFCEESLENGLFSVFFFIYKRVFSGCPNNSYRFCLHYASQPLNPFNGLCDCIWQAANICCSWNVICCGVVWWSHV